MVDTCNNRRLEYGLFKAHLNLTYKYSSAVKDECTDLLLLLFAIFIGKKEVTSDVLNSSRKVLRLLHWLVVRRELKYPMGKTILWPRF